MPSNKGSFKKGHKIGIGNKYRLGIPPWNKGLTKENSNTKGSRKLGSKDSIKRNTKNYILSAKRGKDNVSFGKIPPNFKGDEASYSAKHYWMSRHYGQPSTCEHCQKPNLTGKKIHWANKSGLYKREREDWLRLCVKCHFLFDKQNKTHENKSRNIK